MADRGMATRRMFRSALWSPSTSSGWSARQDLPYRQPGGRSDDARRLRLDPVLVCGVIIFGSARRFDGLRWLAGAQPKAAIVQAPGRSSAKELSRQRAIVVIQH